MNSNMKAFVAVLVISGASQLGWAQTKPSVTQEMVVDYVLPPSTLNDAVQASAAIVVGRVRSVRTYQPPPSGASVRLAYTVEVTEVVRNHPEITLPELQVFRFGGDVDGGDHVTKIVERGFPRFTIGHQYVMFLSWNRVLNGFEVKFGPDGIYELLPNGSLETPGHSALAQSQKLKGAAALIADLKRAAPLH